MTQNGPSPPFEDAAGGTEMGGVPLFRSPGSLCQSRSHDPPPPSVEARGTNQHACLLVTAHDPAGPASGGALHLAGEEKRGERSVYLLLFAGQFVVAVRRTRCRPARSLAELEMARQPPTDVFPSLITPPTAAAEINSRP